MELFYRNTFPHDVSIFQDGNDPICTAKQIKQISQPCQSSDLHISTRSRAQNVNEISNFFRPQTTEGFSSWKMKMYPNAYNDSISRRNWSCSEKCLLLIRFVNFYYPFLWDFFSYLNDKNCWQTPEGNQAVQNPFECSCALSLQ